MEFAPSSGPVLARAGDLVSGATRHSLCNLAALLLQLKGNAVCAGAAFAQLQLVLKSLALCTTTIIVQGMHGLSLSGFTEISIGRIYHSCP